MKLNELLINQMLTVQIVFGEQKIEFYSDVVDKEGTDVFITPYIHNAAPLELNINGDKGVVCNLYTDDSMSNRRISWKGVELLTVSRNNNTVYCVKTHMFNNISNVDERRQHERTLVQVVGKVTDENRGDEHKIIIHDISDNGISFYAKDSFSPASQKLFISFTDKIDKKEFDIQLDCSVSRTQKEYGHNIIGCRILRENKNYLLYAMLKHLKGKIVTIVNEGDSSVTDTRADDTGETDNNQSE